MNKRGDLEYLYDIKESIELILEYVKDTSQNEFKNNQEKQDAVVNRMNVIGEATKNLSQEIRDNYPDIPWKRMAGMRDVLIHQYHGIDLEVVWQTINQELPEVGQRIGQIIEELEG